MIDGLGLTAASIEVFASMLSVGVLLVDGGGDLRVASPLACELLGAADPAGLRDRWPDLRGRMAIGNAVRGATQPRRHRVIAPVAGPHEAPRVLRLEAHRIDAENGGGHLVFIKGEGLDASETAIVNASRCRTDQNALAGRLHDLNGPLNNFTLTLALLESVVVRQLGSAPSDDTLVRCKRYVDILQGEAGRLGAWSHGMGASLNAEAEPRAAIELGDLLERTSRELRHHAALHEIGLAVDVAMPESRVGTDGAALAHALLSLTLAAMSVTTPGGRVLLTGAERDRSVTIGIAVEGGALPAAAVRAFDALVSHPLPAWIDLVAGRLIVEAQGGVASLRFASDSAFAIEASFPRVAS